MLDKYGRDLTALARAKGLDPVIGREQEILGLARALVGRKKNNALVIGLAGVGKTCVVEGFASMLAGPDAPPLLAGKRVVELTMTALVAGTTYRGDFEERMQKVIEAAREDPKLVLFIDELHTVMGAGAARGGASDAAQILKPALARGELRLIGATTPAEYQRHIARDPAFERRFAIIEVDEPTEAQTLQILTGLRQRFETHYRLSIGDDALEAAVSLSKRYIQGRQLPDKAIDLVDQACARKVLPLQGKAGDRLARADVERLVADKCNIEPELLGRNVGDARGQLARLQPFLAARVFGQPDAVHRVAGALEQAYGGLKDPERPVASFLFLGPTGVGKTEVAKCLSEFLFGDRNQLVRIDMSEFMEKHSVSRLIGSPPGYVGYDDEGQLTGPLLLGSNRVVLLDEIEKAHPDVLLLLLQILDEGRLTDARGRVASFRESVVVMTSNLVVEASAGKRLGFRLPHEHGSAANVADGDEADDIRSQLSQRLRPELVGRIGEVVLFGALDRDAARQIIDKTARAALARLHARGTTVTLSDTFADELLERLGSLSFGARTIERQVAEAIGQQMQDTEQDASAPPAASQLAGDSRHKLAILAFDTVEPVEGFAQAISARVATSAQGSELRFVQINGATLLMVFSDVPAALAVAQQHPSFTTPDGRCLALRRLVHRGAVHGDGKGTPQGMGVGLVELLLVALRSARSGAALLVTGQGRDGLPHAERQRLTLLNASEAGELVAITNTELWCERRDGT